MNTQKFIIIGCSLLLFLSCSDTEIVEEISYEIIEEGHFSYSEVDKIEKQYIVFKRENEWLDFIPQIERVEPRRADYLKKLNVDFNNKYLIIVIGEFFNYCCSEITINRIYERNRRLVVDFEESGPGILAALSQAYIILEINEHE